MIVDLSKKKKINKLLYIKKLIDNCISTNQNQINKIKNAKQVNSNDIVTLAKNISLTSRAPYLWQTGMPLDPSFGHGPCLLLEELTGGLLRTYQMNSYQRIQSNEISNFNVNESKDNDDSAITEKIIDNSVTDTINSTKRMINNSTELKRENRTTSKGNKPQIKQNVEPDERNTKKARTINLSFGLSDSEDSEDD